MDGRRATTILIAQRPLVHRSALIRYTSSKVHNPQSREVGFGFEHNQGFGNLVMAGKRKLVVAVEDLHYRHRLDAVGKHVFVCIAGQHKPRFFGCFAGFQTHMDCIHNLALPEDLLECGKPWLPSKSDFSTRVAKSRKVALGGQKSANEPAWNRLRSTVALRWKMCKTRKKGLLKKKYFVATEQPSLPAKSVLVRVLKQFIFRTVYGRNWSCLLDPSMYEMCFEWISSAGETQTVANWIAAIQRLPIELPRDRKLQGLQVDCKLLLCLFPKCGEHIPGCPLFNSIRDSLIGDALQYLRAKRELLQWQQGPKLMDFQGAYEDYQQWKADHKQRSIAKATTNLLAEYTRRGMTDVEAREAVSISDFGCSSTSIGFAFIAYQCWQCVFCL